MVKKYRLSKMQQNSKTGTLFISVPKSEAEARNWTTDTYFEPIFDEDGVKFKAIK